MTPALEDLVLFYFQLLMPVEPYRFRLQSEPYNLTVLSMGEASSKTLSQLGHVVEPFANQLPCA